MRPGLYRGLLLLVLAGGVTQLFAQAKANVAIMPFSGDKTVSSDQLEFITAKFSGELIATNAFKVLDRGKMDFILQEQGFQQTGACNSSECKVQIGQLLGVDNLVAGKLVRFGSTYALHLDIIDVSSGEIMKTVDSEEKGELEDAYKPLCRNAATQLDIAVNKRTVPVDALPKVTSRPLSTKRKVALAFWGASLGGAGVGYYFNRQGDDYERNYKSAISAKNAEASMTAYENTQDAETHRNLSYEVSVANVLVGAALWFWPEGK